MNAEQRRALHGLAAKQAIANVLAVHSRGVDRADRDLLASAYHSGATVDYGFFNGPAAQLAEILATAQTGQPVTLHRTSNTWIQPSGTRAVSESYVIAYMEHPGPQGGTQRLIGGRYLDTHEERDGRWRLVHRIYVMDWNINRPSTVSWPAPAVALGQFAPRGAQGAADPGRALLALAAAHFEPDGDTNVSKTLKPSDSELDVVLAKQALLELCMAYARAVDRADQRLLAALFHEDAVVVSGLVNGTGGKFAEEITAYVTRNLQRCFHSVANFWFEVSGDRAVGESYVIATFTAGGNDTMVGGRYVDSFERRNGAWKFASRTFVTDWNMTHPSSFESDGMYASLTTRGCFGSEDPVYKLWPKA